MREPSGKAEPQRSPYRPVVYRVICADGTHEIPHGYEGPSPLRAALESVFLNLYWRWNPWLKDCGPHVVQVTRTVR